ncbi:hypothetical protein PPNK14_23340 [Pectobacterium parmentieri]
MPKNGQQTIYDNTVIPVSPLNHLMKTGKLSCINLSTGRLDQKSLDETVEAVTGNEDACSLMRSKIAICHDLFPVLQSRASKGNLRQHRQNTRNDD